MLETVLSHLKILENGRDSGTFTARESSTDVDEDDVDLEISSFWLREAWFPKVSGKQRSLNSNNILNAADEQTISLQRRRLFISSCYDQGIFNT